MQKGLAGIYILIVVLILAGLGGVYYFSKSQTFRNADRDMIVNISPTSQPTVSPVPSSVETAPPDSGVANWKTYTNEKYKFAFSYPSNWKASEDPQSSFVQLQEIKEGKTLSIVGGITVVDKAISTYPAYVKMFASKTKCPKEAGSIDLADTTNVYCLTGKELQISVNTWKGAVECSASYLYGEKGNPEACPHQFWIQTKDFFYIFHLNFFEPIIKGSKEEMLFDQILSTFKFTN